MEKVYVNPDHSSQLLVQMSELWRKDKFCDAVLVLRNARFKLHKLVLMAACPGIQATQSMAEEKSHFQISLPDDYDMTAVVNVLDYLYDGAVRLRCDNVHKVQKLAKYLQLHSLVNYCLDFKSIHENQDANVNEKNALLIKRIKLEPGTYMESIGDSKEKMTNEHISSSSDIMDSSEDVNVSERTDALSEHADSQTSKAGPGSVDIEEETEMHHFQAISQKTMVQEANYQCDTCAKMFMTVSGLQKHLKRHSGRKPYSCSDCGASFYERSSLKEHENVHAFHALLFFICAICGKKYRQRGGLHNHMRLHTETHKCKTCSRAFQTKRLLLAHEEVHRGKVECPKCHKKFLHLVEHSKICQVPRSACITCTVCGENFKERRYLREHFRGKHAQSQRFQCPKCGKIFSYRASLYRHQQICTDTNKSVQTPTNLYKHQQICTNLE